MGGRDDVWSGAEYERAPVPRVAPWMGTRCGLRVPIFGIGSEPLTVPRARFARLRNDHGISGSQIGHRSFVDELMFSFRCARVDSESGTARDRSG